MRGGNRIGYELDLLNLLLWTSAVAVFLCIFGLIALLEGSFVPLALIGVFVAAAIPLNYAFYFWRSKSLFASAAQPGNRT